MIVVMIELKRFSFNTFDNIWSDSLFRSIEIFNSIYFYFVSFSEFIFKNFFEWCINNWLSFRLSISNCLLYTSDAADE